MRTGVGRCVTLAISGRAFSVDGSFLEASRRTHRRAGRDWRRGWVAAQATQRRWLSRLPEAISTRMLLRRGGGIAGPLVLRPRPWLFC